MSEARTPEAVGAYVDEAAKLIGLPIAPEHRPGVIAFLGGLLGAADLVMEFPLPEEVEAAPVFEPAPKAP
jgi:1-carboxybiuret hydrolase subunit AtzG-like